MCAYATPRLPSPSAPTTRQGGASADDSITTQSAVVRSLEAGAVTTRSSDVSAHDGFISSRRSNICQQPSAVISRQQTRADGAPRSEQHSHEQHSQHVAAQGRADAAARRLRMGAAGGVLARRVACWRGAHVAVCGAPALAMPRMPYSQCFTWKLSSGIAEVDAPPPPCNQPPGLMRWMAELICRHAHRGRLTTRAGG